MFSPTQPYLSNVAVLLVTNNRAFEQVVRRMVTEHYGMTVIVSSASLQMVESVCATTSTQVALIDLDVPKMASLQIIQAIGNWQPAIKIIAMSMLQDDLYQRAAESSGADAFVPKSMMVTVLPQTIERLLGNHSVNGRDAHKE